MKKSMPLLKSHLVVIAITLLLSINVNAQQGLTLTSSTTAACNANGSMFVTISGGSVPYSVSIYGTAINSDFSSPTDTFTLNNLMGGIYEVYVADTNQQYGWAYINVKAPFDTIIASSTPENCSNSDGTASVTLTGGTPPYTYLWTNGATTPTVTGIKSGVYDVEISDAAGCRYKASYYGKDSMVSVGYGIQVENNSPINLSISATNSSFCVDGTATVIPSGGTAPYTYYWKDYYNPSTPIQTTQTAINLSRGYYQVKVTDANGCFAESAINVSSNIFDPYIYSTPENCNDNNGQAGISIDSTSGIYTFLWDNAQTTQTATGFNAGTHSVDISDGTCTITKTFNILSTTNLVLNITSTIPTCGNSDASATATPTNGTAPYTYLWSNGQSGQTATGLAKGGYNVKITDINGCSKHQIFNINEDSSCFVFISGYVYNDEDSDCVHDVNENGLPYVYINLSGSSNYVSYTDANGFYAFNVPTGTYIISQSYSYWNNNLTQTCPLSPNTFTVTLSTPGTTSIGNDFGNMVIPRIDLSVHPGWSPSRPGFNMNYWIYYYNNGTSIMNGTVKFTHDPKLVYVSSYPAADVYSSTTQTAEWNFINLQPIGWSGWQKVNITMWVPDSITLNTLLFNCSSIFPITGDDYPIDNFVCDSTLVTGSMDPNSIEVFPKGQSTEGYITRADSVLKYIVNFQNTGTDTAFTIVLKDTLDASLDITTLQPGGASHQYTLTIEKNNILVFTFNNIMLPDSNRNEKNSHGLVSYDIHWKNQIPFGTKITNQAGIYFDFNKPVITNSVLNTLFDPTTGLTKFSLEDKKELTVYPNPFEEKTTLSYSLQKNAMVSLEVFNVLGEKVKSILCNQNQNVGTYNFILSSKNLNLPAGQTLLQMNFYLVKLNIDGKVCTRKVFMVR